MLPPLVLQPIIENAVRHGVMKRKRGGTVTIAVSRDDHYVSLTVEDDGVGIPGERLDELLKDTEGAGGIGLKNIQKRLLRLYGHGLAIESVEGQGTKVTIRIPAE